MQPYLFSRKIKLNGPSLPYNKDTNSVAYLVTELNNCHWGAIKLFYSELEFLLLCSKYVDINECLVLYIGAQPGFRLKEIFMKHFFPKIHMLLYDPLPFDIQANEQITIRTGENGYFVNESVDEVLKIANGRKILYISDIRIGDPTHHETEKLIHNDLQKQQEWGVMMGADFMLLKFRMFYYNESPDEINFIENKRTDKYIDKVVHQHDEIKHNSKSKFMLYLDGTIYSQLYSTKRSLETRLFVKKIKYYKNHDIYSDQDQEKYKMKYYDNLHYESIMNYYNVKVRFEPVVYKKSNKLVDYLPGNIVSYTSASEYYLMRKFLKYANDDKHPKFGKILNKVVLLYTMLYERYANNLITCAQKNYHQERKTHRNLLAKLYEENIDIAVERYNEQFENVRKTKLLNDDVKRKFIKEHDELKNTLLKIQNGRVTRKNVDLDTIKQFK
jgi:hypothetical protein